MKTKRLLSVALAVFMLFSSLSLFSSCSKSDKPTSHLEDILDATFGDGSKQAKKGSSSLEILFRPTDDLPLEGLGDISLTVFGNEKNESVIRLRADIMEQLLDLDLFADEEALVAVSSMFGDQAYGLPVSELEGFLENLLAELSFRTNFDDEEGFPIGDSLSVVAPESGVSNLLGALLERLASLLNTPEFNKALEDIAERYLDIVESSLNNDVEFTADSDKNGTTLSYTFNNDSVKKMIRALIEEVRDDDEVRELLREILSTLVPEEEIDALLMTIDAALNDETVLDDLFVTFDETPFSLTFRIGADSDDVLNLFEIILDFTEDGERGRVSISYDHTDPSTHSLTFKLEAYDSASATFKEFGHIGLSYQATTDTAGSYVGALRVSFFDKGAGMELTVLTVKHNRETGDYTINLPLATFGLDADLTLKGNYKTEENKTVLTITELTAPTLGTIALDLTITVTENVTLPDAPSSYKNILTMTEDDFEALQQALLEHPLVQLFVKDGELLPKPPMNNPESGENPGIAPMPEVTVDTTNNDETNPPDSMEFHGKFMNDDTRLTLSDSGKAIFFLDNSASQNGLSLYSMIEIVGIVVDDTHEGITVSFATEGASIKTKMEITGTGAAEYIAAQKAQMNASSLSDAEKAMYTDMFNGKEIFVVYGDPLWNRVVSLRNYEITFLLDGENGTFTEVTEEDEPEVDVSVKVEK